MKVRFVRLASFGAGFLATLLVGLVAFAEFTSDETQWASCVAQTSSPDELVALASGVTPVPKTCSSRSGLRVRVFRHPGSEGEPELKHTLDRELSDNEVYQSGKYAKVLDASRRDVFTVARIADIGRTLQSAASVRLKGFACGHLDTKEVLAISDVDPTLAVALVSRHARIADLEEVQRVAMELLEAARETAMEHARGLTEDICATRWDQEFLNQKKEWAIFTVGEHPWAPGCSVVLEGDDVLLRCLEP